MLCPCGTYAHGGDMTKLEELKKAWHAADAACIAADDARYAIDAAWQAAEEAYADAFDVWKAADNAYEAALKEKK